MLSVGPLVGFVGTLIPLERLLEYNSVQYLC